MERERKRKIERKIERKKDREKEREIVNLNRNGSNHNYEFLISKKTIHQNKSDKLDSYCTHDKSLVFKCFLPDSVASRIDPHSWL